MKRGELYRVYKALKQDPKKYRVFVVVSRQVLIDSKFSTVICAPIYSSYEGISTQVPLGIENGLKHSCSIHCDELVSIPKRALTDYIGTLSTDKLTLLNNALSIALELEV
ncbi:MAG: type II toxin-antitoxin system PemK/MazF family toxin [Spirochaetota bacterium]